MDGHQPENVYTQFRKTVEVGFRGSERAFVRELADIDLIDHGLLHPGRVFDFREIAFRSRGLTGRQAQESEQKEQNLFHNVIFI